MKIATFNINNVRSGLPNLLNWMRETSPDVVCLQELKATDSEFPAAAIRDAGYEANLARAEDVERGGHSIATEANPDLERAARRP